MLQATETHPVIQAITNPGPEDRVVLVIEGGGMRGAVSGGMGLGLHELGLGDSFDAVYGSSAGALNGLWLLSGRAEDGVPTWTDAELGKIVMDKKRIIGPRPIVDMKTVIEQHYERISPGLFQAALEANTEFHPIATDIETGQAVDLHPGIRDRDSLVLALRSTSTLPLIGGPPVEMDGRHYLDAGLSAAIPFRAAIEGGATHLLVLRSRKAGDVATDPSGLGGRLTTRMLGRISPAVREGYLTRGRREGEDEAFLARHDVENGLSPSILQVRPDPDSPVPSRLESNLDVVRAGLESGRVAVHRCFEAYGA